MDIKEIKPAIPLVYCKDHKTICMPFGGELACCLKAKIKELEERLNFYLKGNAKYYHDIHCSANRNQPMGCEGCSCEIGRELKGLRIRVKELEEENKSNQLFILEVNKILKEFSIERRKI